MTTTTRSFGHARQKREGFCVTTRVCFDMKADMDAQKPKRETTRQCSYNQWQRQGERGSIGRSVVLISLHTVLASHLHLRGQSPRPTLQLSLAGGVPKCTPRFWCDSKKKRVLQINFATRAPQAREKPRQTMPNIQKQGTSEGALL